MLSLCRLWTLILLIYDLRLALGFSKSTWQVPFQRLKFATRQTSIVAPGAVPTRSSLEVDDTDDDYYSRLFEEEIDEDDGLDEEEEDDFELHLATVAPAETNGEQHHDKQDARVSEYLTREAVKQRKHKRCQVKRSKRLKAARQMALEALGCGGKTPKETNLRQRYNKLKGVYARMLETLDARQEEAMKRARTFVVEREAQRAALATDKNEKSKRVGQQNYLKSIESMREQEAKQIRLIRNLSLSTVLQEEDIMEELSNEDLISVLRIRGNVKGVRKHAKRETLLGLLRQSFNVPLY